MDLIKPDLIPNRKFNLNQSHSSLLILSIIIAIWISLSTIWGEVDEKSLFSLEYEVSWLTDTFEDQLFVFVTFSYLSEINEWWKDDHIDIINLKYHIHYTILNNSPLSWIPRNVWITSLIMRIEWIITRSKWI